MYLNACLFNHCYVCRHVMALTALRPSQALSAALTKHFQQEGSSSLTHAGAVQHNTARALSKTHQTVKNLFESNFISIKSQKSKSKVTLMSKTSQLRICCLICCLCPTHRAFIQSTKGKWTYLPRTSVGDPLTVSCQTCVQSIPEH